MRKIFLFLLIATFCAGAALAHGGKSHRLLGTVKSLQENHLTVTAQDGHEAHVMLTAATTYEQEGKPATRAALKPGVRVAIQLTEDDRSAVKIRIGAAPAANKT